MPQNDRKEKKRKEEKYTHTPNTITTTKVKNRGKKININYIPCGNIHFFGIACVFVFVYTQKYVHNFSIDNAFMLSLGLPICRLSTLYSFFLPLLHSRSAFVFVPLDERVCVFDCDCECVYEIIFIKIHKIRDRFFFVIYFMYICSFFSFLHSERELRLFYNRTSPPYLSFFPSCYIDSAHI